MKTLITLATIILLTSCGTNGPTEVVKEDTSKQDSINLRQHKIDSLNEITRKEIEQLEAEGYGE